MNYIDIIHYAPSNRNTIVFRHPTLDFNVKTRVSVRENQMALVFVDGAKHAVLKEPGQYVIEAGNSFITGSLATLFTGGESLHQCEVYFINTLIFQNLTWTISEMDLQEALLGNYFPFGADGYYSVSVKDPEQLCSLVGQGTGFSTTDVKQFFDPKINVAVKETLSDYIVKKGFVYGELNSHLRELSEIIRPQVTDCFKTVGLSLCDFMFSSISVKKDSCFETVRDYLSDLKGRGILGDSAFRENRYFNYLKTHQTQEHVNPMPMAGMNMGVPGMFISGQGMGMPLGDIFEETAASASHPANDREWKVAYHDMNKPPKVCKQCGTNLDDDARFCPSCGTPAEGAKTSCKFCGEAISVTATFCPKCGMNQKKIDTEEL